MKINYFFKSLFALLMLASLAVNAQFTESDIEFWIGSGSNQAIFVIDWNDSTSQESFAWGFRFDGTTTGEEALNSITAADNNLSVNMAGGFINDLIYLEHSGLGGNPNYWSTWSGTNSSDWIMNMGLSTVINNNDWFGCSYTDFDPAIEPEEPVAVQDLTFVSEIIFDDNIVFPNPCKDNFQISANIKNYDKIEISNISGQVIKTYEAQEFSSGNLDISTIETGMYFVRIVSKRELFVAKILIN